MVQNVPVRQVVAVSHDQVLRQQLGMAPPGTPQIVALGPNVGGGRRVAMVQGFARR